MKNETDRQIPRHTLPTRMCFIFFPHRTKILKFFACPQTAHLALPNPQADPLAKPKEPFLANAFFSLHHVENFLDIICPL